MQITRKSLLTGVVRTLDIDVTFEQIQAWQRGALIQDVMSHISDEEREFIISGVTQKEWNSVYPEE